MNLVNKRLIQVDHNFGNKRGMHHLQLVHLLPETELSKTESILRTSRLYKQNPNILLKKDGFGLIHV